LSHLKNIFIFRLQPVVEESKHGLSCLFDSTLTIEEDSEPPSGICLLETTKQEDEKSLKDAFESPADFFALAQNQVENLSKIDFFLGSVCSLILIFFLDTDIFRFWGVSVSIFLDIAQNFFK
jgi:hypothetical protein